MSISHSEQFVCYLFELRISLLVVLRLFGHINNVFENNRERLSNF